MIGDKTWKRTSLRALSGVEGGAFGHMTATQVGADRSHDPENRHLMVVVWTLVL